MYWRLVSSSILLACYQRLFEEIQSDHDDKQQCRHPSWKRHAYRPQQLAVYRSDGMRCVFRGILIGFLILVTIIYFIIRAFHNASDPDYEEVVDEAARRILEGEADISNVTDRPGVSVSVAIVLIVCLVSVVLLITGIIIVAVTLDPTTADDEESEIESDDSKFVMDPPSFYSHSEYDHLFAEIENDDNDEPHLYFHPDL